MDALEDEIDVDESSALLSGDSDRDYVSSLARGLDVICAFTRHEPRMTLSDVSKAAGLTRATTRRLLLTLVREGYAEKDGRMFSLRPKVLQLGYSALSSVGILDVIQPVMNELSQLTQESIFAAVLTGDDVTYLARATPDRVMAVSINIGNKTPAYATSTGRILLAGEMDASLDRYLERVDLTQHTSRTVSSKAELKEIILEARKCGYAIVDEEFEVGIRSISVPIRDSRSNVIAALNACCPSSRFSLSNMKKELVPALLSAAEKIDRRLPG